ncbi:uncharacterized protein LOC135080355 [Ostrinia nubilalis]|uniref:uncharacterized protein LOC135080355 n=1 Tax=Ostrinia nubilalis TaxID=29057 RepID=UPI00308240F2
MTTPHKHGQSQTVECRVTSEGIVTAQSDDWMVNQHEEEIDYHEQEVENFDLNNSHAVEPEESIEKRPKILIQRVFHQPQKGNVVQKLDYILAKSDEEITKHVFGGLFKSKYYAYKPENYCKKHDPNLPEHIDDGLLKVGDKFDSLETFRLYVDSNAKKWKYYLKCADSHIKDGKSIFVYRCVFAKSSNYNYFNAKGLRKRTSKVPKNECPCRIVLKPVPVTADTLTVVYVCNHHDHPLTDDYFDKLQHGRRIHPSVKEEIMDLLSLDVDREVVKKYCESLTGYKMDGIYFNNLIMRMKRNKIERQFTLDQLREMSRKIEKIKEELGIIDKNDEEETINNEFMSADDEDKTKDKASQIKEAINVLRTVSAPKKVPPKPKTPRNPNIGRRRPKVISKQNYEDFDMETPVTSKSRLEARLQELSFDQETLQSIKHLQDSVRGETENSSSSFQLEFEPSNRIQRNKLKKYAKNSQRVPEPLPTVIPKLEPQAVVIENTQNVDPYEENQDIVYENVMTVVEPVENCNEIIVYESQENNNTEVIAQPEDYCLQFEENTEPKEQTIEQFIMMENLENVPEVHIQVTDLATVSIVSNDEASKTDDQSNNNDEIKNNDQEIPTVTEVHDTAGSDEKLDEVKEANITILGDADKNIDLGTDALYEVVVTDDKKLIPSREFVRSVIFNKPLKPKSKRRLAMPQKAISKGQPRNKAKPSNKGEPSYKAVPSQEERSDLKRIIKQVELDELADDECYMVVVDDIDVDEVQSLSSEDDMSCDYSVENSAVFSRNENIQRNALSSKGKDSLRSNKIEKEIEIIDRLKKMRKILEQDVKKLVVRKDMLVRDIIRAKRCRRF